MAGSQSIVHAPYPTGEKSIIEIRIGGHTGVKVESGAAAIQVDTWIAPYDVEVYEVFRSYRKTDTNHLDAILLRTIDSTKKTVVASLDAGADIDGVSQTLHSDIVGFTIVRGNGIELIASSDSANESGWIMDTIRLRPKFS